MFFAIFISKPSVHVGLLLYVQGIKIMEGRISKDLTPLLNSATAIYTAVYYIHQKIITAFTLKVNSSVSHTWQNLTKIEKSTSGVCSYFQRQQKLHWNVTTGTHNKFRMSKNTNAGFWWVFTYLVNGSQKYCWFFKLVFGVWCLGCVSGPIDKSQIA